MKTGMTVKEAANLLNASEDFVRYGLQTGIFKFGKAVKKVGKKNYGYWISKELFEKEMGIKVSRKDEENDTR